MSDISGPKRRSRLVIAVLVVLAAGPLSAVAALLALSAVTRDQAPNLVPSFWPDPLTPMAIWSREVAADPAKISAARTRDVSLRALRVQPLNASAIRMLALREDALQHVSAASALANLSERLSRRDLLTQLILIKYNVAAGDVKGALLHYDIALRTSPEGEQVLFPVLTKAIADGPVRDGLVPYVRENAPWIGGFLFNAVDAQGGAVAVAKLLLDNRLRNSNAFDPGLTAKLLTKLVDLNELETAEHFFLILPGADRAMLSQTLFNARTTDPRYGILGWLPVASASVSVDFDRTSHDGRQLHVAAEGAATGQVVLRRLFRLPAGRYHFQEWRTVDETNGSASWRISCLGSKDGPTILWNGEPDGVTGAPPEFEIAAACRWQEVDLAVWPSGNGPLDITVDRVLLSPRGNASQPNRGVSVP